MVRVKVCAMFKARLSIRFGVSFSLGSGVGLGLMLWLGLDFRL